MSDAPTAPTAPAEVDEPRELPRDQPATEDLVQEELLVEDISIDGMCGVY